MNAPAQHPPAVRTTCPYCGVGCGVLATPDGRGGATIAGDPEPSREFRPALLEGLRARRDAGARDAPAASDARQSDGTLARELGRRARPGRARLRRTIAAHGPNAVAFYLSGQLLTEDYYVANKLMKGFIGSSNVDTNSRLCMASTVAGHRRAFGADTVPGCYEDLDEADLIVLVGSNAAWCHPVLYQRMVAQQGASAARRSSSSIRAAPRPPRTPICILPSRPAWTAALFCGLLVHLAESDALDYRLYRRAHGRVRRGAGARARSRPSRGDGAATGLARADIARFFELFRATRKGRHLLLAGRQSVGAGHRQGQCDHQLPSGDRAHRQAGHAARSRSPASPMPWAGREVGGLANQLAAHMDFARRGRSRCALLECADMSPRATASRRCRCSTRSSAARSRRCG